MSTFFSRPRAFAPLFTLLLMLTLLLAVPACGGGGGSMPYAPEASLIIPDTTLPLSLSGEGVDYEIPLEGGCGGPYVLTMIDGRMPDGIGTDDEGGRHHLVGTMLTAGVFNFTVQVTDIGCDPFITTTAKYVWDIGVGTLRIVGASPNLIPVDQYDDPQKWPDADAMPKTVYSSFMAADFIVAGGTMPYVCQVVDDPDDPDDGPLPLGTSMPSDGSSIVGTPVQVGAGGKPFRLTIRATDSTGQTIDRKIQWKVDTPAVVISNDALSDGKAGSVYGDLIQIADGVPPFVYELLDDLPTVADEDITNNSPLAPTFPSDSGFTVAVTGEATNKIGDGGGSTLDYPATDDDGPNYSPFPSEGLYLIEDGPDGGTFTGIPRRRGTFTVLIHAYSGLVPNERGQHSFKSLAFTIEPSEPPTVRPPFGFDYSFTDEGVQVASPTYSTIPEFEIGKVYNPDALSHDAEGLQLLAVGGVPADGYSDQPHLKQRATNGEAEGTYLWTGVWNVDNSSLPNPPPGIEMQDPDATGYSNGVVEVTDADALLRQSREIVEFTCHDFQLPDSIRTPTSDKFGFSVGPDVVIITNSSASLTAYRNYYSFSDRHRWNDNEMTIEKFQGFSGGATNGPLNASDLPKTHSVPTTAGLDAVENPLGALLSGAKDSTTQQLMGDKNLDLLRCTINATGWWDDVHGMNPRGARPYAHADANRGAYNYYAQFGPYYHNHGNWQPSVSCVDLPDIEDVTANASLGVDIRGGRCYHFESADRFGVFIIRDDAKIYVPFAYEKDSTIGGFGEGLLRALQSGTGQNSALRTVQMTVSPNGRFAAMKLKDTPTNLYEKAPDSKVVIFSLAGEKLFDNGNTTNDTWTIVESGSAATGTGGLYTNRILHASSMALSDSHLYFLIGTRSATSTINSSTPLSYQSWSGHFLMRYDILNGNPTTGAELIDADDATDTAWTQEQDVPMQTTYHHHGPHYLTGTALNETYTTYGYWPYHRYWREEGMNLYEQGQAPTPFRVSRDGRSVTFLAGENYSSSGGYDVYSNHAWVDVNGEGARRITTKRRHASQGSGRGYALGVGPQENGMWGRYSGPPTGLEISDDGTRVAFTYNTNAGYIYSSYYATYSSHSWMKNREDVLMARTTAGDMWSTLGNTVQEEVTQKTFGGVHRWRFGSLVFTADGTGLVFWGGAPLYNSNYVYATYNESYHFAGSYYIHNTTTANKVTHMLAVADGGNPDGSGKAYTSTSPFSPSSTSSPYYRFGAINPCGGFLSRNRSFFYAVSAGALSSSDGTACKLVGLNISSANTGSINNHTNGRGFKLANWPSRRGFMGRYYYYPRYWLSYSYGYAPANSQGAGRQIMAKDTGWVYWGAYYQYAGPSYSVTSGGPAYPTYYYGAYGYGGSGIYGFNGDLGGAVAQINNPSLSSNTTSTTYNDTLHFMDVSRDGKQLVYVTSNYNMYPYYNRERVNEVHNIDFGTTNGAMHAAFNATTDAGRIEASNGRAGEAVAIVPGGKDVYYAYKAGASNETGKEMVRARLDPTANTWDIKRYTAVTGRMNVLYGTR